MKSGKGYKTAIETLNEGRIGIGAQMLGLAKGALQHAVAYTKERKQFGKAIAEFQAVQHQLARAAVDVEAATLTVYNAARLRDAGRPFLTEAAICKIFASEVAERVASLAVNLFGGIRVRQGLPGRKAVPRREDRTDLRGHVEPPAPDDREADALLSYQLSALSNQLSAFSYQHLARRTYTRLVSEAQYPVHQ